MKSSNFSSNVTRETMVPTSVSGVRGLTCRAGAKQKLAGEKDTRVVQARGRKGMVRARKDAISCYRRYNNGTMELCRGLAGLLLESYWLRVTLRAGHRYREWPVTYFSPSIHYFLLETRAFSRRLLSFLRAASPRARDELVTMTNAVGLPI